jgi:TPR repeat protein
MYNIGVCYEYGTGVDVDKKETVRLYKLATEQGNVYARIYLVRLIGAK